MPQSYEQHIEELRERNAELLYRANRHRINAEMYKVGCQMLGAVVLTYLLCVLPW